jgi:uncharacterized protein (DUF2249 family)
MPGTTATPEFEQVPTDRPREHLDVADAGPPAPLRRTLERLAELPDRTVLVQHNDRVPHHLYPQLEKRGYAFETVDRGEDVVTAVWR